MKRLMIPLCIAVMAAATPAYAEVQELFCKGSVFQGKWPDRRENDFQVFLRIDSESMKGSFHDHPVLLLAEEFDFVKGEGALYQVTDHGDVASITINRHTLRMSVYLSGGYTHYSAQCELFDPKV
ncbi:MAG: hypothetical protein V7742_11405 [Halioglobus sp.]